MPDGDQLTIRSFRVVFELERRIHRIDRWRLPLPYGLPLRSIGYALSALALVLALSAMPLIGDLLGLLAAPLRLVVLPAAAAYALTQLKLDGRSAHRAVASWALWRSSPQRLAGLRRDGPPGRAASLADLWVAPDWRSSRYRPATLNGPATATLRYPARARTTEGELRIRQASDRPLLRAKRVQLKPGQRLVVK